MIILKKKVNNIKKRAFSLMELMVVIGILGMLAIFVLPNLIGKSEDAKKKNVCNQMASISHALKMYKIENSSYPSTSEGLKAVKFDEDRTPKDSWRNDFIYTLNDDKYEIISFGPNKKEGGGDDIYYSKCIDAK